LNFLILQLILLARNINVVHYHLQSLRQDCLKSSVVLWLMDGQDVIFVDVWRVRLKGLLFRVGIPNRSTPIGLIDASVDHDTIELDFAVSMVLFKQHD
jgi:hypothetical protein